MVLDHGADGADGVDGVDWDEVAELVTESYCALAPARLARLVDRPPDRPPDHPPDRADRPPMSSRPAGRRTGDDV